jgi:hypothetical protein
MKIELSDDTVNRLIWDVLYEDLKIFRVDLNRLDSMSILNEADRRDYKDYLRYINALETLLEYYSVK